MDIAAIPIVDFLKFNKSGAKSLGFKWIVCILSRKRDSKDLYDAIERDWMSLDSITGRSMLVIFAGSNEKHVTEVQEDIDRYCVTDRREGYIKRFNPFATVLSKRAGIMTDLSSSQRYGFLNDCLPGVEKNQTDAIDSLRDYLNLKETDIPCLVYIPLYEDITPVKNIVVKLPATGVDLYGYFKKVFNEISPIIDEVFPVRTDQQSRIDNAYEELIAIANQSELKDELMDCIREKQYLRCKQPERGMLSRYIDLCRNYKSDNGVDYEPVETEKVDQIKKIEETLAGIGFSSNKKPVIEPQINIGNNNKLRNCKFVIYIDPTNLDN